MQAVKDGELDLRVLKEDHAEIFARYVCFCMDYISDHTPKFDIPDHPLRPWQEQLCSFLVVFSNDREIIFVYDEDGNAGKTYFVKWFCKHNENSQYMEPGKKADMAYLLDVKMTTLFINVIRQ